MRLMRQTSLTTTTKYIRTVEERMRYAGENLGGDSGRCNSRERPRNAGFAKLERISERAKMLENMNFSEGILVAVVGVEPTTPRI